MSIKFSRLSADNTVLYIPDSDLLNINANADVAYGMTLLFNGLMTGGSAYQQVFAWGGYQATDNLLCNWRPVDSTSRPGEFYFEIDGSTTQRCQVGPVEANQAYILVIQRVANVWTSKLCPIQSSAPTDGSVVLSGLSHAHSAFLNCAEPFRIGGFNNTGRRLDHTMARFFRVERGLTDYEIAQLAYGKEITQFATPSIYLRMNDIADMADHGTQQHVPIAENLKNGPAIPFGFDSSPTAPTITGKPVIVGSPAVGFPVSYTEGTAIGNPSPVASQQWMIKGTDGVVRDIPGATEPTYTPVAADGGKELSVRQIEANGILPNATAVSDPVLIATEVVTLSVTEQLAERVYQQFNGVASVAVEAAFTGSAPAKLEYQLYDVDGTTITKAWADTGLAAANGKFAGNVAMPKHSRKNRIAYRTKNASGTVMFTSPVMANRFGIGDIFIGIGSSSMAAWFGSGSGANMVVDHNLVSTNGGGLSFGLFDSYGQGGQMAMQFATEFGYPVAFLNHSLGGSSLASWADKTSSLFRGFIDWVNFVGGKIAGVFSTCGSNDITGTAAAASVDAHLLKLRTLSANIREVTGQSDLTILTSGINRRSNANSDAQADNARAAEAQWGNDPNNLHVQTLDFELSGDGTHLTGAGFIPCTRRVRYVWVEYKKYGVYRRGPKIQSFRFAEDKINVELLHRSGTDFNPSTGITGFVVTDEKTAGVFTPVNLVSVTRTNATNILITCDQVLVKPKVTYMAGMNPDYPTAVFDNGPMILPMVAEPFMTTNAGAIEVPKVLVPYYATFTFDRVVSSGAVTPPPVEEPVEPEPTPTLGSFTTYQMTSSGTLRVNQSYKAEWRKGGEVGVTAGTSTMKTGITDTQGRAVLTSLPVGAGYVLISFADGGICYQKGTVA